MYKLVMIVEMLSALTYDCINVFSSDVTDLELEDSAWLVLPKMTALLAC